MDELLGECKTPSPATPPATPGPQSGDPIGNERGVTTASGTVAATNGATPAPAALYIRVPIDAELYCDNVKLTLTGVERSFVSPPLPPGRTLPYVLRARWTGHDGRVNDLIRTVQVEAGRKTRVDFLEAEK